MKTQIKLWKRKEKNISTSKYISFIYIHFIIFINKHDLFMQ